jgi:predicted nucleotidyltransferase
MKRIQRDINLLLKTLNYFLFFNYPATLDEIHLFFPKKMNRENLKNLLQEMEEKKIVKKINLSTKDQPRYTVGEYGIKVKTQNFKLKTQKSRRILITLRMIKAKDIVSQKQISLDSGEKQLINSYRKRQAITLKKLKQWRFRIYLKFLSLLPQIKFIGLSGSLAMQNAKVDDDIDLFIITAKNRLWTARLMAVFLAIVLGLKRPRGVKKAPNRVCLNLFFDLADLAVPKQKRSEFVAHEVLQMKPLIDKDNTYLRFLQANRWVFAIFPNATLLNSKFQAPNSKINDISNLGFIIFDLVEVILKNFQLSLINRHRTTELITDTQLWFHPEDFQKRLASDF